MKDILLIGGTHGDEPIGVDIGKKITSTYPTANLIIGNPRAYEQNVRYTDADLNRSAPGDTTSKIYEQRRAKELIELTSDYRYTIDIHGTNNDMGIFIIITNPSRENLALASLLDIDRIVIWPSITPEMQFPLSEFFSCGLEIECGDKNNPKTYDQLDQILTQFMDSYNKLDVSDEAVISRLSKKDIYTMYGKQKRVSDIDIFSMKEFVETTIDGETFVPAFIANYPYQDVLCYKLKQTYIEDIY